MNQKSLPSVDEIVIKDIQVIRGKNRWSETRTQLIQMVLDLGEWEEFPSDKIPFFSERLKEFLPSLWVHRCSIGTEGGFFQRVDDGTWLGHIIEHIALEIQTLAGMDVGWGRTRGVTGEVGVYNVVFNYLDEEVGVMAAKESLQSDAVEDGGDDGASRPLITGRETIQARWTYDSVASDA